MKTSAQSEKVVVRANDEQRSTAKQNWMTPVLRVFPVDGATINSTVKGDGGGHSGS